MEILMKSNIQTGLAPESHEEIIRRCGRMPVNSVYANEPYTEEMIARDCNFSTAIGNFTVIPHLVIGITAKGDEHLEILGQISDAFEDESDVEAAVQNPDSEALYRLLVPGDKQ